MPIIILQKNKIVGSKQKGYYYVNRSGVRVTAPEIKYAVSFVMKNSSPKDSRSKRLRDCFEALCKYQYYRGWLDNDISAASISSYANICSKIIGGIVTDMLLHWHILREFWDMTVGW